LRSGAITYREAVTAGLYCDLGKGVVDWSAIVTELHRLRYSEWVVVEQDRPLAAPGDTAPVDSLRRNRAFLRDLLEVCSAQ
jgi:inosose dehydratase